MLLSSLDAANDVQLLNLLNLRTIVLALGEGAEEPWWNSSFLSHNGRRFLASPFPRSTFWAALHAASVGADSCELYEDICWAKAVQKAFRQGLLATVKELRRHLREIDELPDAGASAQLRTETADLRSELASKLDAATFFDHHADLQSGLSGLKAAVDECCARLCDELDAEIDRRASDLQTMPEWTRLNESHRERIFERIEALKPGGETGLQGLRSLLNRPYAISAELEEIRREILRLAEEEEPVPPEPEPAEKEELTEEKAASSSQPCPAHRKRKRRWKCLKKGGANYPRIA